MLGYPDPRPGIRGGWFDTTETGPPRAVARRTTDLVPAMPSPL